MLTYGTLFLWSFLAATILPLGSEPALFAIVSTGNAIALPVFVATLGNYLGACTTWWLGRKGAEVVEKKSAVRVSDSRAARLFARFGAPALLLSWVPWIGDPLVAIAGASRIGFRAFSLWTIPGKLARYALVATIAATF